MKHNNIKLTGETFLVLLYVQWNLTTSAGSASTSHLTCIECIFKAPTDICSVPGLHLGATAKKSTTNKNRLNLIKSCAFFV